ncbi:MAG: carboxypeptidase regulatory-like domain-containing protein [Candidatus Diapherotrites archaeon]|nr:carboxypeptidase regulatory-like domain-containing protein [Candidatus Diapherotrites archaeon]
MGFYTGIEDKYYAMLDWLDKHGIPVYKVVDAVEANNIPSFPLFLLLCLVAIGLLWFFALAPLLQPMSAVTIYLTSNEQRISGESFTITYESLSEPMVKTSASGGTTINVPTGIEITLRLGRSDNYTAIEKKFTPKNSSESLDFALSEISKVYARTIKLFDSEGKLYDQTRTLTLSFSCSSAEYNVTKPSSNGQILLDAIPKDCGYLNVQFPQGITGDKISLDPATESLQINLSAANARVGKALVSVKDSDGKALAGKKVQLLAASASDTFNSALSFTGTTGSVLIENIPIGNYKAQATDDSGEYYAEATAAQQVKENETTTFNIIMQKTSIGSINFLILDASTGVPVENAKIDLFKGTTAFGSSKFSDAQGKAEFKVAENVQFTASIDHPAFLKMTGVAVSISTADTRVSLTPATAQNSNTLAVKVIDEKGFAIEQAKVKLLKSSDASTIDEKTTGNNGIVVFDRLTEGTYIIKALKTGFGEKVQPNVSVIARQENQLTLTIPIGSGTIDFTAIDEDSNPVPNAAIAVVDNSTGQKIQELTAGTDGKASIQVRADKTVYLQASGQDFLPYYTIPIQMAKDITFEKQVQLAKDIPTFRLEPVGGSALFLGDEKLQDSLNPGQKYTAKFLLKVPQGSEYSEIGAHLRTGLPEIADSSETTQVEADPIYIKGVKAGGKATIVKGKTYNPPNGYATDVQNLTQSESKWANIIIPNGKEGVYEIEAEVYTRETSEKGKTVELRHRAWGKSTGYLRSPKDDVLGSAESSSGKQSLYAETKNIQFSIGPSTLCSDNFCNIFKITDLTTGEETALFDEFSAKISTTYRLYFSTTYRGSSDKPNAMLKISNPDSAIALQNYSIKTFGTASGNELQVNLGNLSGGTVVSGWVEFQTQGEGATKLILELSSGSEKLQAKEIVLDIQPARQLNAELIPKTVVPYIINNLLVKATEISSDNNSANPIPGAVVNFVLNGNLIYSTITDSKGIAQYSLNNPPNNAKLLIEVKKQGFAAFTKEVTISENILLFNPSELRETLVINEASEKQRTLEIINSSPIALMVKKIEFPKMDGHVAFALDSTQTDGFETETGKEGITLERDGNAGFLVKMKITDKGKTIQQPTTFKGTIDITVENPNYSMWVARVPVFITVGFGEEVDSTDCLTVDPAEWKIFTSNDAKSIELTLKNTCKINEQDIELSNLQAKIVLANQSEIGKFKLSTGLPESKDPELSNQFRDVAPLIPKKSETQMTLTFNPLEIDAGASTPKIIIKAVNKTKNGDQELQQEIKISASVNDLTKCVKFAASTTSLQTTPYGTGLGNYNSSYSPFNSWGMGNQPSYIVPNTGNFSSQSSTATPSYIVPNTGNVGLVDSTNPYGTGYNNSSNLYGTGYNQYNNNSPYTTGTAVTNPYYSQYNPDTQYRSPYLDPYTQNYGSTSTPYYNQYQNNYGQSPYNQMAWGQSSATVRITNTCAQSIELEAEADSALQVDQSSFSLKSGEKKNITVQAGYRVGRYTATFSGRIQGSQESMQELSSFLFTIQSAADVVRDCIGIDRTKFEFNDFIGKPVKGKIYNNCWDIGVKLNESADTISLSEMSDRLEERIGGSPQVGMAGTARILGITTQAGSGLNGGTRQVLDFEMERDFRYRQAPEIDKTGKTFQQIGALRYWSNMGQYRVQTRATLSVRFIDTTGMQQMKPFEVTLEDLWRIGEMADALTSGNPKLDDLQKCINDVLNGNLDDKWFGGTDIKTYDPITEKIQKVLSISDQTCSTLDKLSELQLDKTDFGNGVIISAQVSGDGHNVTVTVNRANLATGQSVQIKGNITATLTSFVGKKPSGTSTLEFTAKKKVNIPYNFNVSKGIGQPLPPDTGTVNYAVQGCKQGPEAVPKILLDWKFESISKSTCDATYCDAAQFTIESLLKAKEVKPLVDAAKNSTEFTIDKKDYTITDEAFKANNNFRKASEIYRFLTKQVKISDGSKPDAASKDKFSALVFFLDNDSSKTILTRSLTNDEITKLDDSLKAAEASIASALKEPKEADKFNAFFTSLGTMQTLLKAMADTKTLGDNVLLQFNQSNTTELETYSGTRAEIGVSGKDSYYLMTLGEFKIMHDSLKKAIESTTTKPTTDAPTLERCNDVKEKATKCWIKPIDPNDTDHDKIDKMTEINIAFLKYMTANITVRIGVRNQAVMSEEDIATVLDNGARVDGEGANALNKKFYYENIKFHALLVKDNYSTVKAGFDKVYSSNYSDIPKVSENWTFNSDSTEEIAEAGDYNAVLDYDWSESTTENKDKVDIKFAKAKEFDKTRQKSAWYAVGFDGRVKSNDTGIAQTIILNDNEGTGKEAKANIAQVAAVNEFNPTSLLYNSTGFTEEYKKIGKVFELTSGSLTYYPTQKGEITAAITGTNAATNKGIEYRLKEDSTEVPATTLVYWNSSKNESQQALCNYLRPGQIPPYVRSLITGAAGTFKANLFLPVTRTYEFQLVCGSDSAIITVPDKQSVSAAGIQTSNGGGIVNLSTKANPLTIQKLLEEVKNKGKYCIKESDDGSKSEIYWKVDAPAASSVPQAPAAPSQPAQPPSQPPEPKPPAQPTRP